MTTTPTRTRSHAEQIESAANRLPLKMGVRREIKAVAAELETGEIVDRFLVGYVDGKAGLLVLTDRRVLWILYNMVHKATASHRFAKLHSATHTATITTGKLTLHASGATVSYVVTGGIDSKNFFDAVCRGIEAGGPSLPKGPGAVSRAGRTQVAPDTTTRLRELADLHTAGSLTDTEFESAKALVLAGK